MSVTRRDAAIWVVAVVWTACLALASYSLHTLAREFAGSTLVCSPPPGYKMVKE